MTFSGRFGERSGQRVKLHLTHGGHIWVRFTHVPDLLSDHNYQVFGFPNSKGELVFFCFVGRKVISTGQQNKPR